jgi:hypothetical protein
MSKAVITVNIIYSSGKIERKRYECSSDSSIHSVMLQCSGYMKLAPQFKITGFQIFCEIKDETDTSNSHPSCA